ncbi:hypothetical protein AC249_AIPGENE3500 [Exaiptasia diaphana]|nr:hypothetical protein AC249_AIPGENE3500 [Exaiptasia diaphana]
MPTDGNSSLFGKIVSQIWEDVRLVKRGPKKNRQYYYSNLGYRDREENCLDDNLEQRKGWTFIRNNENDISFVNLGDSFYKGGRSTTELRVMMSSQVNEFTLSYLGRCCSLNDVLALSVIWDRVRYSARQIAIILDLLEVSGRCAAIQQSGNNIHPECQIVVSTPNQKCEKCHENERREKKREKRHQINENSGAPQATTNKRFLSKDDIILQLQQEKKKRKMAEKKVKYWTQKFEKECLEMTSDDNDDLIKIFYDNDSKAIPVGMEELWKQQKSLLECKNSNAYRWHPKIMRLCLDLYCKNPHVLDPLREFLILPSNKTIRLYKNKVKESPGWNDEVLRWCAKAAHEAHLKPCDYYGGFVIDEMKIQENIEMSSIGGKHRLVGFVNLGKGHDVMRTLSGQGDDPEIATHVLQFIFLSDGGFRFPIAQWPSASCSPTDLYHNFWDGVLKMLQYGFSIYWCILDGADCNRQFIQLHFKGKDDYIVKKFTIMNIFTGDPMIFIMVPKHNIKKIRNNVFKRNFTEKPRCLKIGGKSIVWKYFREAYEWDQDSFSLPLHEKLTPTHGPRYSKYNAQQTSRRCPR